MIRLVNKQDNSVSRLRVREHLDDVLDLTAYSLAGNFNNDWQGAITPLLKWTIQVRTGLHRVEYKATGAAVYSQLKKLINLRS